MVWILQHFLRGITKILKPLGPGGPAKTVDVGHSQEIDCNTVDG